jgi:hypothetical protein
MFVSTCQSILRLSWRMYSLMQTMYDFQRSYGLIRHKFLYLPKTEILLGAWLYVRISLYRASLCRWRSSKQPIVCIVLSYVVYVEIFREPTGCIVLSYARGDLPTADWLYRAVLCTWRSSDSQLAASCCPMYVEIFRQPTGCIVLSYVRGDLPTAGWLYRAVL